MTTEPKNDLTRLNKTLTELDEVKREMLEMVRRGSVKGADAAAVAGRAYAECVRSELSVLDRIGLEGGSAAPK